MTDESKQISPCPFCGQPMIRVLDARPCGQSGNHYIWGCSNDGEIDDLKPCPFGASNDWTRRYIVWDTVEGREFHEWLCQMITLGRRAQHVINIQDDLTGNWNDDRGEYAIIRILEGAGGEDDIGKEPDR